MQLVIQSYFYSFMYGQYCLANNEIHVIYLNSDYFAIVEMVREKIQLNWPDAETGLASEEQNRACTVLSNYIDHGRQYKISNT